MGVSEKNVGVSRCKWALIGVNRREQVVEDDGGKDGRMEGWKYSVLIAPVDSVNLLSSREVEARRTLPPAKGAPGRDVVTTQ